MTPELTRRICFTLGALLVFRLGTFVPLPGIAPSVWEQIFRSQADSTLGMANLPSGGAIHRRAIFALGLVPYVSALIGAIYLALVYLLPAALVAMAPIPFYFGGASLLIVVCAILDLENHIRGFALIRTGVSRQ